jgi:transcriptional regulator
MQTLDEAHWSAATGDRLVAPYYPLLLDKDCDRLAVFMHMGRPDEQLHGFGEREIMLIVQGVHGYISPSWYAPGATRSRLRRPAPRCGRA